MTVTNNAILGASARHMAEYTPTAEELHDVGTSMGRPTTTLSNGRDVSVYQALPKNDRTIHNSSRSASAKTSTPTDATHGTNQTFSVTNLPTIQEGSAFLPPPERLEDKEKKFRTRVTKRGVNVLLSAGDVEVRLAKRIVGGLADSTSAVRLIADSYVSTHDTGIPSPGMSQQALEAMHTFVQSVHNTPATTPAATPAKSNSK